MLKTYVAVKALIKKGDNFLILKNKDSDQNDNLCGWETPGGRLEDGEEVINGLKREIREEAGLVTEILFPFNAYSGDTSAENAIIGISYLAEYVDGEVVIDTEEHSEFKWASMKEIRSLVSSVGLQKEIDAYEKFMEYIKEA